MASLVVVTQASTLAGDVTERGGGRPNPAAPLSPRSDGVASAPPTQFAVEWQLAARPGEGPISTDGEAGCEPQPSRSPNPTRLAS